MRKENRYSSSSIDLCGEWLFSWVEEPAAKIASLKMAQEAGLDFGKCTVPGNFELDLYKIGELPDPFFGMNPVKVRKATEKCHVFYTRSFQAEDMSGAAPVLIFEGLDCFAEVFLNGMPTACFANMLIEQEVNVKDFLHTGTNEIFIHIRPAVIEALQFEYPQFIGSLPTNYESLYVRKAPHMYGWDIMPRFLSAGMYRPVTIEYRPDERIDELYLRTIDINENHSLARLMMFYKISGTIDGKYRIKIRMKLGDSVEEVSVKLQFISGKVEFAVKNPFLWWPRGRGDANLYDVDVILYKNNSMIDTRCFKHGIRTVDLKRTTLTSSTGEGAFVFKVNGENIFIKGSNWVPVDAFHSRDRERIPAILQMVNDLNCNMLRCWGGNVYEDELFYDICDRSGILVWQDFAMACSMYPQDDAFARQIAIEAAVVIKRLRSHCCIALWSGDNECDWSYLWGFSHTDPNTNVLTRKIIPEALRLHDGTRPYIGSSPFFDEGTLEKGIDYLPEMHLWGPRDYFKSKFYVTSLCHFVSEIGYHGCPAPESIARFISQDKLWPCTNNDEWLLHGTSPVPEVHASDYRVELMCKQITELFSDMPDNLREFSFASQVVQAEALKFFIELFRIAKWRRTGILWWNIMDGWPQFSDAVVDYYFERKLAYYFIKNSQQDVCVMMNEPDSWNQKIVISNDTRCDKVVQCQIKDVSSDETVFEGRFVAYADQSTVVGQIPYLRNKQRFYAISWQGDAVGQNHYLAGQPPFNLQEYTGWLTKSELYKEKLRAFLDQ